MKTNFFSLPGLRSSQQKAHRSANEVRVGKSTLFHLQGDHRGERIDVVSGLVWVTQSGDDEDHLLKRGESLTISQSGTVVAQGMQESALRVVEPC